MSAPLAQPNQLTSAEEALVRRSCRDLGLESALPLVRLTEGRSGSLVVRLRNADEELILKVTTDPDRLARARREMMLIAHAPEGLESVVPDFVAGASSDSIVSLATRAHRPLPPASELSHAEWCDLASNLGAMHAAAETVPPDGLPPDSALDDRAVAEATRAWRNRSEEELADQGLARLHDDAGQALDVPVPVTLEHGDCHTENIVRDDCGRFRWIDWQEAHLGTGLATSSSCGREQSSPAPSRHAAR